MHRLAKRQMTWQRDMRDVGAFLCPQPFAHFPDRPEPAARSDYGRWRNYRRTIREECRIMSSR